MQQQRMEQVSVLKHDEHSQLYQSVNTLRCDAVTHTIHIPVMEKADRLTGRTIQAVIGLAVSWLCPKHGVRGGLRAGVATRRRIGWGVGGDAGSLTHRETHRGGHERKKGGMAQLFCSTGPCNQQQPERRRKHDQ